MPLTYLWIFANFTFRASRQSVGLGYFFLFLGISSDPGPLTIPCKTALPFLSLQTMGPPESDRHSPNPLT